MCGSLGDEFRIVNDRLSELLHHRLVDTLVLAWCLFEYKQKATSETGLYVIVVTPALTFLL